MEVDGEKLNEKYMTLHICVQRKHFIYVENPKLSVGFNLVASFPSDSSGSKTRIVLLPPRIKIWGLHHIP